ncbi:MAG: PqqD family protein [Thermoguttaceae bacterium]|nr:PqqD family protein [Thermoguttaceae bacterium]
MKLNPEFVLRTLDDTTILVPFGRAQVDFNGMLTVNAVGAFLVEQLQSDVTEDELVERLTARYEVDAETARKDVASFLNSLRQCKALQE